MPRIIFFLIPLILFTSCSTDHMSSTIESGIPLGYYDDLATSCRGDSCCLASVEAMRRGSHREVSGNTCPVGMRRNLMKCISSKQWCEPSLEIGTGTQSLTVGNTGGTIKDFGSGFTLSQTDDETTLSYSGKIIKSWSHTPLKDVPFIWDGVCKELSNAFEITKKNTIDANDYSWKQKTWESLSEKERKKCTTEITLQNIEIATINTRFFSIIEKHWESADSDLFDASSGNILFHINGGTADNISIENNLLYVLKNGAYSENEIYTYSFTEKRVTKVLTEKGISKKGETPDNSEYIAALERFKNQSK